MIVAEKMEKYLQKMNTSSNDKGCLKKDLKCLIEGC
jgi:hypothetical protein